MNWTNLPIPPTAVTKDYNDNTCKYRYERLQKKVYLVNADAVKNIHIDAVLDIQSDDAKNSLAYIDGITQIPMVIDAYSLSLEEGEELDERYAFTHQLSFSINGYANYKDFEGRYYVLVCDYEDTFWLLNPSFPCKVTFTYTLDNNSSHTDFTLSTISNFPMLRVYEKLEGVPYNCNGYNLSNFKTLLVNETSYSSKDNDNNITYSNDGFKEIVFNKGSQVFTETFDGDNVTHSITVNVGFNDYKSSWHYNLLEFTDNKYAAIMKDSIGNFITCGFGFGLAPSYTVYGSDGDEVNRIEVVFSDVHDNGNFVTVTTTATISGDGATSWIFTSDYNGSECVRLNTARYLLKKEVDLFGNSTGRYQCLSGYESQFSNLNIVGTFDETEEFISSSCAAPSCGGYSGIPNPLVLNSVGTNVYTFMCESDWTLSSSNTGVTVSPTSGVANQSYEVSITNNIQPSYASVSVNLTLNYCHNKELTAIIPIKIYTCIDTYYEIDANGGNITIPSNCCVSSVTSTGDSFITDIQINSNSIKLRIPKNPSSEGRGLFLNVTFCDGSEIRPNIWQKRRYEEWVSEGFVCNGGEKCEQLRLYTGATQYSINPTSEIMYVNCELSDRCATKISRWITLSDTYCLGGKLYYIEVEDISYDDGESWEESGNKRLGDETDYTCSIEDYEYRWLATDYTQCFGVDMVYLYKKQRRISGSSDAWEDIIPTVFSIDGDSTLQIRYEERNCWDCGYVAPVTEKYRWSQTENEYICDDCARISYFSIVALEDGNIEWSGLTAENKLYYSTDNGETWNDGGSNLYVSVSNGDRILFKGNCIPTSNGIGRFINTTCKFNAEGNIMSLIFGDNFSGQTNLNGYDNAFQSLFTSSKIKSAENLMLPATVLSQYCYALMFYNCTKLEKAPMLPAKNLVSYCYYRMFRDCEKLNYITCLATDLGAINCTTEWVYDVAANGTFIKNVSMNGWSFGENEIPDDWKVEDMII